MKGGVILFRGTGAAACRYLESDRSRADDYYLEGGTALAGFTVTEGSGQVLSTSELDAGAYAGWVDWVDPLTGNSMGKPRLPGEEGTAKHGSPRFAEMVVNTPKSLSVAAALHPDVSDALDAAQTDAVAEIRRFLGLHSVTRVGPRGRQEVVPVERLQTVAVVHKTSRAGDPHRHVHFQIGTRVWAAGRWRGLDTAAVFKQQGAIRALGTAVLAAHPRLAQVLERHGLTLDPVWGEVVELTPFNAVMSKRASQVEKNLAELEAAWAERYPGVEPGPVVTSRMVAAAWAKDRPQKRPTTLAHEDGWRQELAEAGYDAELVHQPLSRGGPLVQVPALPDDLRVLTVASRALDRCAAQASTWTRHTVAEQVTRIVTEYGVRATPGEVRDLVELATDLAVGDCLSVLPPGTAQPEHVAHLTSLEVVAAETRLCDLLTNRAATTVKAHAIDVTALAAEHGLDDGQMRAAAAIASADPLVVVEGAAGAGKTTMLAVAINAAAAEGRATKVVTPTKRAADVAARELGVPAESVAKLLHAHGWRWNSDGVWTRLAAGELEPETGSTYGGPPAWARLARGERIVVDEAGMLDQNSAIALLTVAGEAGATVALVGDRAQLSAVGRGGVLDLAAVFVTGSGGTVFDMDSVHRFADPIYADFTLRLRAGHDPANLFDQLHALGHVHLHRSTDDAREDIATATTAGIEATSTVAATAATNEEVRTLNEQIRARRVARGEVDDTATVSGNDELPIGVGDVIATRRNDSTLGVANRQTWTVQSIGDDGTVWALDAASPRRHPRSVALPSSYVTVHAHLAYAATAYGVQGVTTTSAHTLLSEALDASGVYVGMTRGRESNVLHIVADDLEEAREQFIDALQRDRADRGLQAATSDAQAAVVGLTAEGPVKVVNDERTRLVEVIAHAQREAARWEHAAGLLAAQVETHGREEASVRDALANADAHLTAVLDDTVEPLLAQATADGQAYLGAHEQQEAAWHATRSTGRLGGRAARRSLDTAQAETHAARATALDRWGSLPATAKWAATSRDGLEAWATRVARQRADAEPLVTNARRQVAQAGEALKQIRWRHRTENEELTIGVYGRRDAASLRRFNGERSAQGRAQRWQRYADASRADLARIESLPIGRALQFIETRRAQALQVEVEQAAAAHSARLGVPTERRIGQTDPELGRRM
jgi:AAA domain/TrwC relaxase